MRPRVPPFLATPLITPCGYGPFSSFWGTILAWGQIHSVAGCDEILWCGYRLLPKNSELKKKRSSARNLRLCLGVHSCFSPWNETLLTLGGGGGGGHKQYFLGAGPKLHSSGTGPVTFLWGTFIARGSTFFA